MKKLKNILFFVISSWLLYGCSATRHLPPGEKLYTGAIVNVSGPSLGVRERKTLRTDLKGLTKPKPNTKFLGLRIKLFIYNLFRNKKPTSFFGKIREKSGQPPVLLSQLDLANNIKLLRNYLENKGWFHATVVADTIIHHRLARATYKIKTGEQYKISSVHFPPDSSDLAQVIGLSAKNTLLEKGKPFDMDVIKAERLRIDGFLKERGFYYFSPDYLLVKTDSTIGNNMVDMFVTVKPNTPKAAAQVFTINDVYIYRNYSLNTPKEDTVKADAQFYKGYYVVDKRKKYKPVLFERAMQFNPGDVYNRTAHNQTLNRLINLDLFKFVKNRFEISAVDSPKLNAFYYLTPYPAKSVRAEITVTTRSNNLNGSQLNFSWKNRNVFRAGEHLTFTSYVGSDVQFSGALKGYNTYRTGAEVNFAIPRFFAPFLQLRSRGGYLPRTNLQIGYDILKRNKLFTLNSYRFAYGYLWKENIQKQHEFYPISITLVEPLSVTHVYDSLGLLNRTLLKAIQKQFILGSTYQYNYNQLANGLQPDNAYYFNGLIDLSGNIAGLLSGANVKKGKEVTIYNAAFSQYIKLESDVRYYRKFGLYNTWASRLLLGFGMPYGNSLELPYIKQFFIGGNNSLRGFRSRSVGPGTYIDTSTFIPDQTGDIKFEVNTELRPKINGPLYGAIFLEAGNIWLFNDSTYTHKDGAQFTSKFLSQLAIDAGIGLRFDITLFIIRLDIGFPLRKPWEQNSRLNEIHFSSRAWRQQNIVYNLAIGYPF